VGRVERERNFLFFSICVFLPAFKKEQFSKAERRGEQIKATLVREGEEVTGESTEIKASIVQSSQTSQTSQSQHTPYSVDLFRNIHCCQQM
jgi:hypothetical protein